MFGNAEADLRQDPQWVKSSTGHFHRLVHLDPEKEGLSGVSGVFVIWHGGVNPQWIYIGKSNNLAKKFHDLGENEEIMDYEVHGGLFVSWSLIRGEFQDGVLSYLKQSLEPKMENTSISIGDGVEPVPVIAPGGKLD